MPALDHLLDDLVGLARLRAPARLDRALALDQRPGRARPTSAPAGWRPRRAWRAACRAPPACAWSPADFQRHQHADLAEARRQRVVDVGGDHALARPRQRGGAAQLMFSPIVAISSVDLLGDRAAGRRHRRPLQRLDDRRRASSASPAIVAHERLEHLVAGDEVGLGVDLDQRARAGRRAAPPTRPSAATRPAFLAALARPLVRSQSIAASMSPPVSSAPSCSPSCRRRSSRAVP